MHERRNWASLGAFVTIIALLIEPFLQATVALRGQNVATGVASSVHVARRIDLGSMVPMTDGAAIGFVRVESGTLQKDTDWTFFPDFRLTSSFTGGLSPPISGDAGRDLVSQFRCVTGNCTWPIYTTAAMCSRCNDIPQSRIARASGVVVMANMSDGTDYSFRSSNFDALTPFTTYSLSYGHIKHIDGPKGYNSHLTGNVSLTAFLNEDYRTSVSFQDMDTTVATLLIMRAADEYEQGKSNWEDSVPTATECALYVCAKAYEASATNGLLHETEIGTWVIREPRSWSTADHPEHQSPTISAETRLRWQDYDRANSSLGDTDFLRTDLQVVIPESELPPEPAGSSSIQRTFNMSQATIRGLQSTMSSIFRVANHESLNGNSTTIKYLVYPNNNPYFTTDSPRVLYNSANMTATFERLANSLTVQFRESSLDADVAGVEERYILHVQVDWPFFYLLVVTVGLGCIYVVGVLIQTYRLSLPSWKESVYPVLTYGFNDETQLRLRALQEASYTSPKAKKEMNGMRVGFLDGEYGYRLVAQPSS